MEVADLSLLSRLSGQKTLIRQPSCPRRPEPYQSQRGEGGSGVRPGNNFNHFLFRFVLSVS